MNDTSSPTQGRPLLTFALFAYNQEKYIREAIEGAFSQTYEPLEIILSDDCSSDQTFEIMQEMVAGYAGPHNIVLNQNKKNLGLIGHVNFISRLSKSEYIIAAAGDDISKPTRAEVVSREILKSHPSLIHSNVKQMDEIGNFGEIVNYNPTLWNDVDPSAAAVSVGLYIGATGVWRKDLFSKYGEIKSLAAYEDLVLGYRASLEGNITFINEPLVLYRIGSGISYMPSKKEDRKAQRVRYARRNSARVASFEQRMMDTQISSHEKKTELISLLRSKIAIYRVKSNLYSSPIDFLIKDLWRPLIIVHFLRSASRTILGKKR